MKKLLLRCVHLKRKCNLNNVKICTEFLSHLEEHPLELIYTEGSKTDQHVGFAAVFKGSAYIVRLPGKASLPTAELYAIRTAMIKILELNKENGSCTIFSHSQSTPLAVKSGGRVSLIAWEFKAIDNPLKQKPKNKLLLSSWTYQYLIEQNGRCCCKKGYNK